MGPSINLGFATRDFCKRPCGSAGPLAKKQGPEAEEVLKVHGTFRPLAVRTPRSVVVLRTEKLDKFSHGNTLLTRQVGDLRGIRSETTGCVSELNIVCRCLVQELEKCPLWQVEEPCKLMYQKRIWNVVISKYRKGSGPYEASGPRSVKPHLSR